MRRIYYYPLICAAAAAVACSDDTTQTDSGEQERIEVRAVAAEIGGMAVGSVGSRAVPGYSVNTDNDPTFGLDAKQTWLLDLQIYDGDVIYPQGATTFAYSTVNDQWEPQSTIHFPNYLRQDVSALLHPPGWDDDPVPAVQNTADILLAQDILEQDGNGTTVVYPAHIPDIPLRHSRSLLDFVLDDVVESQIQNVTVEIEGVTYTPLRLPGVTEVEYMLIMPVGVDAPVVKVLTVDGARYRRALDLGGESQVNYAYCVTLEGLPLLLSTITVTKWDYGEAIPGYYTPLASYPTFFGPVDRSFTLVFDNDQEQELTFNDHGEVTARPYGRIVVALVIDGQRVDLSPPIVLRGMMIDLEPYFP